MKATYYPPNSRVVVLLPRGPYTRQRGVVVSTRNIGGDMGTACGSRTAPQPSTTPWR